MAHQLKPDRLVTMTSAADKNGFPPPPLPLRQAAPTLPRHEGEGKARPAAGLKITERKTKGFEIQLLNGSGGPEKGRLGIKGAEKASPAKVVGQEIM